MHRDPARIESASFTPLAPAEQARLDEVRDGAASVRVPICTLLDEYHDNVARADATYKGRVVQVPGTVGVLVGRLVV